MLHWGPASEGIEGTESCRATLPRPQKNFGGLLLAA